MIHVDIIESKYLEYINCDPDVNISKFYRLTLLSNGKWLRQNGRIGRAGSAEIYDQNNPNNDYIEKYNEKIAKGYYEDTDPDPQFIEVGLNLRGFTSKPHRAEQVVDKEKLENNLAKILTIKHAVYTSNIDETVKDSMIKRINEIYRSVDNEYKFTVEDINYLENIWQQV